MSEEEAHRKLAHAIVVQAVVDWRDLCYETGALGTSFGEIRNFLKSKWGALLCGSLDPALVLNAIEREKKHIEKQNKI